MKILKITMEIKIKVQSLGDQRLDLSALERALLRDLGWRINS